MWSIAVIPNLSEKYRLKAAACEKTSRETDDPVTKVAWIEIAIEWHTLASRIAQDHELETAQS
jgi:hypothetical protein